MILRQPTPRGLNESQMARYIRWLGQQGYPQFAQYDDLHKWSVEKPEEFWKSIWEWGGVISHAPFRKVLEHPKMPGAEWFSGAKLNFAENLLRFALHGSKEKCALTALSESRPTVRMTYGKLLDAVMRFANFLRSRNVKVGDRVAGVVTNGPEALIAMLATTSIGAVWSSCSPDFGFQGILDRFGQIEPKLLVANDGYQYNGKKFECVDRIQQIHNAVPSILELVWIGDGPGGVRWDEVLEETSAGGFQFEPVPFDHPVYILYSSGTTGVPKCIVHGGGGVLLQHMKELRLHSDIQLNDKFFYFTTCGWMMWNWLASGLMTGAELILYDGSPSYPTIHRLWEMAESEGVTVFGTSAKFIASCRNAGISPKKDFSLATLKTILSTGSPLMPEDFDWVYSHVKKDVLLSSIAGGTDIVYCFVLGNPMLPVRRGEIQCKGLGMDVAALDENGKEVVDEKGELVCRKPTPSMPIYFWNDADGKKYKAAYFETYPGMWRHGDYVQFTKEGGVIIFGRSDSTLNPGGVRIGTSEIYRQVETVEEVADSLAVGQPFEGDERVILFVVLKSGFSLTPELETKIKERIRKNTSPRHVPAKVIEVQEIPYTLSGKKVEIAVGQILRGETVKNRDALANPQSLDQFQRLIQLKNI